GDAGALAEALIRVLDNKGRYAKDSNLIGNCFAPAQTAVDYTRLFESLALGLAPKPTGEPPAYDRLRVMRDQSR
ncbi:MAG TPA: hypothetical protein VF434_13075, partial [Promineifilum sp.]